MNQIHFLALFRKLFLDSKGSLLYTFLRDLHHLLQFFFVKSLGKNLSTLAPIFTCMSE
jgi:hypothetical protein